MDSNVRQEEKYRIQRGERRRQDMIQHGDNEKWHEDKVKIKINTQVVRGNSTQMRNGTT